MKVYYWIERRLFMKIKEVIERTGLTDRAIRLYIDNGLLNPRIEESYSGRKSIDFAEEDIERLNNIAMLRKAGFSISDVKNMAENNGIKDIVEKFIVGTETEIGYKTEIVEKLENISFNEEVTIETICNALSSTVEKTEIPFEDMNLTAKETVKKVLSVISASFLLAFSTVFLVMACAVIFDYRYIRFDPNDFDVLCVHSCWLVLIALSITILWRSTGKRFIKNSKGKAKGLTAVLIVISIIGCTVLTPFSFLLMVFATPFYSQTTDIENYMNFDESLEIELNCDYTYYPIYEVFPRKIPLSAKEISPKYPYNPEVPDTTKYYYNFTSCPDGNYGTYDIFAEWVLPNDEYERAKEELPGDICLDNDIFEISQLDISEEDKDYLINKRIENNSYIVENKGDWTVIYYINDEAMHTYLIAAYNDKEHKMRYIASSRCIHEEFENGSYYLTLDW